MNILSMAGPTSLSPNFCELQLPDPFTLCHDRRKSMENNQVAEFGLDDLQAKWHKVKI
jgi:hypothetical protein